MWARLDNSYTVGSTAIVLISGRGGLKNFLWQNTLTAQDTLADLTIVAIDQLYSHDVCLHEIQESSWIRTLGTSHPFGMNVRVDSL